MGDAEESEPNWDPISEVEESDGESGDANEEDEAATAENDRAALAASQDGGGGEGQCPPHHEYNVMLTKFGGTRARGEDKAPVAIAIVLEAHEEELMQRTQQRQTWEPVAPWTQSSAIADPRGGRDDARDQTWITAGPYITEEPNPSALAEEPKKEIAPAETIAHIEGAQPRLLMVCLLYTSPSPRDRQKSRMPSSA